MSGVDLLKGSSFCSFICSLGDHMFERFVFSDSLCSANPELGTLCNFVAPVMKFGFTVVGKK